MANVKRPKKGKDDVLIDAEFRIKCEKAIEEFCESDEVVIFSQQKNFVQHMQC